MREGMDPSLVPQAEKDAMINLEAMEAGEVYKVADHLIEHRT